MFSLRSISRISALGALVATAACTTYSPATSRTLEPRRHVRVHFPAPVELRLGCDVASAPGGHAIACDSTARVMSGIVSLEGNVRLVDADSMLVAISSVRDSLGNPMTLEPPRTTWVARGASVVDYRHTSTGRTVLLVVLTVATAAVVVALLSAQEDPAPKPAGSGFGY